jgi:hypothetical protein
LLEAQNIFSEHAQSLKAKISKRYNEELAAVEVVPSDRLPEPHPDDVPALAEALREAASHRPEIEQADLNLHNQQIAIQATRNSLLPFWIDTTLHCPKPLMGTFTVYPIFLAHLSRQISIYLLVHSRSPASAGFAFAPLRLGLASARSFRRS